MAIMAKGKGAGKGKSMPQKKVQAQQVGVGKSELAEFLQKLNKTSLTKEDLAYDTSETREDDGKLTFISTVVLSCMDGKQFAGQPQPNRKLAEHSAAAAAIKGCRKQYNEVMGQKRKETPGSTPPQVAKKQKTANGAFVPTSGSPWPSSADVAAQGGARRMQPTLGHAANGASQDPNLKSDLVNFLRKHCERNIEKGEVTYETTPSEGAEGGFQSCVQLHCLDDKQIFGDVKPSKKAAEASAAGRALREVGGKPTKPKQKQKMTGAGAGFQKGALAAPVGSSSKADLHQHCVKAAGRDIKKGEISYETEEAEDRQWQSTVQLLCLGHDSGYTGSPEASKSAAEASAASAALLGLGVAVTSKKQKQSQQVMNAGKGGKGAMAAAGGKGGKAGKSGKANSKQKKANSFGRDSSEANPKSSLQDAVQKQIGRSIVKDDLIYDTAAVMSEVGEAQQSTLTIAALNGEIFAGEPQASKKLAEQSAARMAMQMMGLTS